MDNSQLLAYDNHPDGTEHMHLLIKTISFGAVKKIRQR